MHSSIYKLRLTALLTALLLILPALPGLAEADAFAGGEGTADSPWQIATAQQLDQVRNHLDAHFVLVADIDLAEYANWQPIGAFTPLSDAPEHAEVPLPDVAFTGSFDGGGHVISHLTVSAPEAMAVGLFGCVTGSADGQSFLRNLILSDVNVTGAYLVGGAIGLQYQNFAVDSITLTGDNHLQGCQGIGGIVGTGFELAIENCAASADIAVLGDDGGFAGIVVGGTTGGSLIDCTATGGSITAEGDRACAIGGVCGAPYAATDISGCRAEGVTLTVSGADGSFIGGIAGFAGTYAPEAPTTFAGDAVENVAIAVSDSARYVGGILGGGWPQGETTSAFALENCAASGQITGGASHVGSAVGNPDGAQAVDCTGSMGEGLPLTGSAQ